MLKAIQSRAWGFFVICKMKVCVNRSPAYAKCFIKLSMTRETIKYGCRQAWNEDYYCLVEETSKKMLTFAEWILNKEPSFFAL